MGVIVDIRTWDSCRWLVIIVIAGVLEDNVKGERRHGSCRTDSIINGNRKQHGCLQLVTDLISKREPICMAKH